MNSFSDPFLKKPKLFILIRGLSKCRTRHQRDIYSGCTDTRDQCYFKKMTKFFMSPIDSLRLFSVYDLFNRKKPIALFYTVLF